jgi:ketosteroid isomerase-like protein
MHKLFTITLILLAPLSLAGQAEVWASEDARFAAQVAQDVDALRELVADDLLYIHSNALVETREDFLASVQSGNIRYLDMRPEGKRELVRYGRTAVTNGIVKVLGRYQGREFDIQLRYTAVYRKQRNNWQLVRWQSTRLPDE